MEWIQKLITLLGNLFRFNSGMKEHYSSDTDQTSDSKNNNLSPTICTAEITAVYSGYGPDIHALNMDSITLPRKGKLYVNLRTQVAESVTLGLELNGIPVVIDEKDHTVVSIDTLSEKSGKIDAYYFAWPEPNGYPIGKWNAEFIIRDSLNKIVFRKGFTLCIVIS